MNTLLLSNYQAVILCGGQGTRIRAVAEDRPKPMIEIGGRPILWHIMKIYSRHGIKRFILALGHQGEKIIEYFQNFHAYNRDFTLRIGEDTAPKFISNPGNNGNAVDDWEITFAHTGADTMTGGRLGRIRQYIDQDDFFCTYGDGVSNVDIPAVFKHHKKNHNIATLVGVHLPTTFGIVEADESGQISGFREKPVLPGYINGGFFCFSRGIFDYIDGDEVVLEDKPFKRLVGDGKLGMVPHTGFWHAMDHYKDYATLNALWKNGVAPWRTW